MIKILLDKRETANAVSLSESTISRMVSNGEFPQPVRAGGRVLWRAGDIDKWSKGLSNIPARKETRGRKRLAV